MKVEVASTQLTNLEAGSMQLIRTEDSKPHYLQEEAEEVVAFWAPILERTEEEAEASRCHPHEEEEEVEADQYSRQQQPEGEPVSSSRKGTVRLAIIITMGPIRRRAGELTSLPTLAVLLQQKEGEGVEALDSSHPVLVVVVAADCSSQMREAAEVYSRKEAAVVEAAALLPEVQEAASKWAAEEQARQVEGRLAARLEGGRPSRRLEGAKAMRPG